MRTRLLLLCLALCSACSSAPETRESTPPPAPYRYAALAEMSRDYLAARDGSIGVLRPEGWLLTSDEAEAPSIVLWLVNEEYSASLTFVHMQMDPALYETLRKDGIEAVAKVSLGLKQRSADDVVHVVQPVELFRIAGKICAAYEYRTGTAEALIRVVVFDTGSRFMECTMFPASNTITPAGNRKLFEVQQSVLASLVVK
ncbi:MAG: hypothetical protein M5R41_14970 [Bacteroidia bacterium]|nr:hypothetical protein [Bacteroidia bacterium]